ncbi:5,6,7,8-tetrahydromethanopterin hydro-lyase [Collimonas sp. PA-H2]|uniref:formaldehyde-activating enzyme n=1 Tax=Collimonas sp. PA-H2 TaxID=1881062 RepID=UPI000BF89B48|nr:formaldehyde-activating enzyme [Collimonas sp. PA-H2]PFH11224.1 5,6,7,8-tetrahydromethanopterin hydro-lyase [Collimonas sp. PA-H2]
MIKIGEGFCGSGPNAAHINLFLGPKNGPMGTATVTAASSPGPGHIPFQAVLKPNMPVKPTTVFIGKAVLTTPNHENMTWGPAQAGVAHGVTKALLDGVLPPEAEDEWIAVAAVWVNPLADDADQVYANNCEATYLAAQRALAKGWPSRKELAEALGSISNPFYTPKK